MIITDRIRDLCAAGAIMMCVTLAGCGGGVPAPPDGGQDMGGTDTPDNTDNGSGSGSQAGGGGTTDSGGAPVDFSAQISVRPDVFSAFVGDVLRLSANVTGSTGPFDYQWSAEPVNVAVLDNATTPSPLLTTQAPGAVTVRLILTDQASAEQVMSERTLTVEIEEIQPPADAMVRACNMVTCELQVFDSGGLIELRPSITGSDPVSIEWVSDPANVLADDQVQLTNLEDGLATVNIPGFLGFVFELRYIVIVTYDNGSTLSDVMVIRKL